jgi:predicted Rossmann fold flavoprotein
VDTDSASFRASSVILATGGLSVPTTGSDGRGLRMAASLGHVVCQTYPALTPLSALPAPHAHLSGISLPVRIRARANDTVTESYGGFLFTHRGYSGPAVLDVSHVAVRSDAHAAEPATLRVQWSELDADAWRRALSGAAGLVGPAVARVLPQRLAAQLIEEACVPSDRRAAELRRDERERLVEHLSSYLLPWTDNEGYRKAEVTGGGVALDEVDGGTLESRRHPGLFFCGEMLDAFGPIGGHNFAWAWSTARLAGRGAAARV